MAGFLGNGPTGAGRASRFQYAATAGQTTFSGIDQNGLTMKYTPGYVEVAVNGIWLPPSDYTATDGSTIVLPQGTVVTDVVYVYALGVFAVQDSVSFLTAQTLSAAQKLQARQNAGAAASTWTVSVITATNPAWPVPANATEMIIEGNGAGASGAGQAASTQRGAGGGGGAYGYKYYTGTMDSTLNITIAAGGAAVTAAPGNSGGSTSIVGTNLGTLVLGGGIAPSATGFGGSGGAGGVPSGPWTLSRNGGDGSTAGPTASPGAGAYGFGGDSPKGGTGGKANVGSGGQIPGGGGAGENHSGGNSGVGARAEITIWTR